MTFLAVNSPGHCCILIVVKELEQASRLHHAKLKHGWAEGSQSFPNTRAPCCSVPQRHPREQQSLLPPAAATSGESVGVGPQGTDWSSCHKSTFKWFCNHSHCGHDIVSGGKIKWKPLERLQCPKPKWLGKSCTLWHCWASKPQLQGFYKVDHAFITLTAQGRAVHNVQRKMYFFLLQIKWLEVTLPAW